MKTKAGSTTVHPWYNGIHEWQVEAIAQLSQPVEYNDPVQGKVSYDPRVLSLESPEHGNVLWFTYWISTNKTQGKMKWGQGSPMLEETVLLNLMKDAIEQGLFTKDFLKGLAGRLDGALSK